MNTDIMTAIEPVEHLTGFEVDLQVDLYCLKVKSVSLGQASVRVMSQQTTIPGPPFQLCADPEQVRLLPDGAVSVEARGGDLVLRASHQLQERFEELIERRKAGTLSGAENDEYEAICELDEALSWLNRLARSVRTGA